jgi:hypothetical protein
MLSMTMANCGHFRNARDIFTDYYGYTWCVYCADDDTDIAVSDCARLSARVRDTRVYSLTGLPLGVVSERVTNSGARTPTNGRYSSDRMTVRDRFGGTWYANGPKDASKSIVLRRA